MSEPVIVRALRTVLIANRGEIALRVIRACREMGLASVAVYSDADAAALHVRAADRAVRLGPAPALESYLDIGRVIDAARASGADAVHPGYGFLAENAAFAAACEDAGLVFIGPPPDVIEKMGSKIGSRALMAASGIPIVPGETPADQSDGSLAAAADRLGYPLLVKASAGGGGKGMRAVRQPAELRAALAGARHEARVAFGDDTLYLERLLERPRHIEVQVMADAHGQVVHLFERDCSVQRRHQKVLEESPSPALSPALRARITATAARAAAAIGYRNAGTIEFLVVPRRSTEAPMADGSATAGAGTSAAGAARTSPAGVKVGPAGAGAARIVEAGPAAAGAAQGFSPVFADDAEFFFLEMNTRLQVEHPVTEAVTGVDLVRAQLLVAAGHPLPWRQEDLRQRGHAIECRIYAEDPARDFLPQAGRLLLYRQPARPGIRIDAGVEEGSLVPVHYDPLLAKLVAHAETRDLALARAVAALREFPILGIRTNLPFLVRLLNHPAVRAGDIDTWFLDRAGEALVAGRRMQLPVFVPQASSGTAARPRQNAPEGDSPGGVKPDSTTEQQRLAEAEPCVGPSAGQADHGRGGLAEPDLDVLSPALAAAALHDERPAPADGSGAGAPALDPWVTIKRSG